MEIECPNQAVAIWTEGDTIQVRFPDRQLIAIPVVEWPRLFTILKHREDSVTKRRPMTVGTLAAPVQYDIDKVAKLMKENDAMLADKANGKAAANRERLLRKDRKMQASKEADELLALAGL
jgi:hypothetical protein